MRTNFALSCVLTLAALFPSGVAEAQITFNKKTITTEAAEKMANACLEWYKTPKPRGKPAIFVLNADGDVIYMKRVDGSNKVGVETARMKAESSLYLFRPTSAVREF